MTQQIVGLAIVFGLLGALALWARRRPVPSRRLDVIETTALGQGRAVAVVRAGSKRLLVGVTGSSITTLAQLDASEWSDGERGDGEWRDGEKHDRLASAP